MASSAPFKFKKEPTVVDQDTATEVIKRKFKPKAKPVKFTWQGARNFLTTLTGPTTMKLDRIRDLTEKNVKAEDKDYIDFFEDLEKAGLSAADKLGYALTDLATSGIDLGAKVIGQETQLNERIRDVYEENKMAEPETLTGKVTEVLLQYGVPSTGAFKITNRLRKFATAQKAKAAIAGTLGTTTSNIASKSGYMATAFGITDFVATEPGRGNLVLEEEDTENLTGSELAAARFRNRIRFGAEGAAIGGLFGLVGKPAAAIGKYGIAKPVGFGLRYGVGPVFQGASYLLSKDKVVLPSVAKGLRKGTSYTLEKMIAPLLVGRVPIKTQLPPFE